MIQKNNIIVFLGDSQFEYCNWNELLVRSDMLNYGIAGDTTSGLIGRVEVVCQHNPSKIFIEIGTNDLSMGFSIKTIMANYGQLIKTIKSRVTTEIYINSVLPVQDLPGENYQNIAILELNRNIKMFCKNESLNYIDLTDIFMDDNTGNLKVEYTTDGLHLSVNGYLEWKKVLLPFIKEI
ncbi:MAG: lysophospholipase L1-like esterase [Saprospiraceae bacterium]|jgi:lysophospholipase L1-like esterase